MTIANLSSAVQYTKAMEIEVMHKEIVRNHLEEKLKLEQEKWQQEKEDAGVRTQRVENPAVEDYKNNYLRGGDYRRGGAPE